MTVTEIEAMLLSAPMDRVTSWSSSSLKISDAEFDSIADQLYDLDFRGMIEISERGRKAIRGSGTTRLWCFAVGNDCFALPKIPKSSTAWRDRMVCQ